jgi:hypothetical protein
LNALARFPHNRDACAAGFNNLQGSRLRSEVPQQELQKNVQSWGSGTGK